MKRLIVAVAMVLAFVLPAGADQQFMVWVNNVPLQADAIMHNDRIYIPLRAVSEGMGYAVTWDGYNAKINSQVNRPPIVGGDEHFQKVVTQAMDLLEEKDPAHYVLMCQNAVSIWINSQKSSIKGDLFVYARCDGNSIAFTPEYIKTDNFTPEYVAALLSHETVHIAYFKTHDDLSDYKKNERMAYETELVTLKLIDAPPWITSEVQESYKSSIK